MQWEQCVNLSPVRDTWPRKFAGREELFLPPPVRLMLYSMFSQTPCSSNPILAAKVRVYLLSSIWSWIMGTYEKLAVKSRYIKSLIKNLYTVSDTWPTFLLIGNLGKLLVFCSGKIDSFHLPIYPKWCSYSACYVTTCVYTVWLNPGCIVAKGYSLTWKGLVLSKM